MIVSNAVENEILAVLSLIDITPRQLSEASLEQLKHLAFLIENEHYQKNNNQKGNVEHMLLRLNNNVNVLITNSQQ